MVSGKPEDFRGYLAGIGMGTAQIEQAETALATVRGFLPEEPEYLFVSEYRDDEGNRNYEGLWIFTAKFISEAAPFTGDRRFDLIRRDIGLDHVAVEDTEFDFDAPVDASRLRVVCTFGRSLVNGTLRASGSNCADLNQVLRDYLLAMMFDG